MSQQTFDQNLFGKKKLCGGISEKPRGLKGFLVTVDEVTSHVVVVCRQRRHRDLRGSPAIPIGNGIILIPNLSSRDYFWCAPLETISRA